jgi:uncharacterized protein YbgA (DUF1722 family)/uncharacterized protein YbbK (DUF523 family)
LGYEHCRYNGNIIEEPVVEHLKPFIEAQTVCPEVQIGLGVPRPPIRLVRQGDQLRLLQPETGRDLTETMTAFVDETLVPDLDVDGFILKSASPSCGPREVRAYTSLKRGASFKKEAGTFGGPVLERYPHCAIEDEGRLRNFDIRHHFLTRLFSVARFRQARSDGRPRDLVRFHTEHKLLLMAYNQTELRAMGRIVANPEHRPMDEVWASYAGHLDAALRRLPRRTSAINVLMHALGYVSDELTSREKAFLLDSLEQYREQHVPLSAPTSIVRSWIIRFEQPYLSEQIYFEPFPQALVEVLDSGKGRKL